MRVLISCEFNVIYTNNIRGCSLHKLFTLYVFNCMDVVFLIETNACDCSCRCNAGPQHVTMELLALNSLLMFDVVFVFFLFLVGVSCLLHYLPPPRRADLGPPPPPQRASRTPAPADVVMAPTDARPPRGTPVAHV